MRQAFGGVLVAAGLLASAAVAQDATYVQIEAHRSLAKAQERARAYGGLLQDMNGFRIGGGWYALALGPYTDAEARTILARLRQDGLIPRDSYIVEDGGPYREQFWPAAGAAGTADGARGADASAAPPPPPADETPQEARRSEQALGRGEREDLQRALQWFGHYRARIDGSFGRGTRNAMAAWQQAEGLEVTGILTSRQRVALLRAWREAQAALGLTPLVQDQAGISLTAPMGLVRFERVEAPFVHYAPEGDSGVRMSLISQPGDRRALGGLYEVMQTLDIVPPEGERSRSARGFRIAGKGDGRSTEVVARLQDGHILGFLLSWPDAQENAARRALAAMEQSLAKSGAPLDPEAGFEAEAQRFDMVAGLEVRRPLRAASGMFVDGSGAVATAADTVEGCARITLDRVHEAEVVLVRDGVAVLRPTGPLAPLGTAVLDTVPGRLRGEVSVAGFPFGGVLGTATRSFGTLEDIRGLAGEPELLRLSIDVQPGDAGGPVLDGAGRVTGMLLPPPDDGRRLPEGVAFALNAATLAEILAEAGVQPKIEGSGETLDPVDLSRRAAGLTALVGCWD